MYIAQQLVNGFPSLSTGNIADAGHSDVKIMDFAIKPLHVDMRLAGPAYTVDIPQGTNFSIQEAASLAPKGSVIVINAHGDMSTGHMGDLIALAFQVRGIAGVVIDGAIRDIEGIIKIGFPLFARGAYPRGNKFQKGTLNQTISCGGIEIKPGDMIFGDATGVVAFPQAKAQEIYDKAVFIANSELGFVQLLNEGKTLLAIPEFLKLHNIDMNELKK